MGMATSQLRLMYFNAYRLDLEYKIQLITEAKMNLSKTCTDLLNVGTDLDADDPMVKKLEARKERLNVMEKKLDMQMQQYQNKLKMIDTEYSSCENMLQKNIERSFKY